MKVLDASAVLAKLRRETGHENIEFAGSILSLVNFAEVATVLVRDGHEVDELAQDLVSLGVELRPLTPVVALLAGELYAVTKTRGLSLGDRACLALARTLDVPAVTAESAWDGLEHGARVGRVR